jgi:fibronectin type 3 domain-containing protein
VELKVEADGNPATALVSAWRDEVPVVMLWRGLPQHRDPAVLERARAAVAAARGVAVTQPKHILSLEAFDVWAQFAEVDPATGAPICCDLNTGATATPAALAAAWRQRPAAEPAPTPPGADAVLIPAQGLAVDGRTTERAEYVAALWTAAEAYLAAHSSPDLFLDPMLPLADVDARTLAGRSGVVPLALTFPTAPGTTLELFWDYGIRWVASPAAGREVSLEICHADAPAIRIADHVPAEQGLFHWSVPGEWLPGADYRIRISATDAKAGFVAGECRVALASCSTLPALAEDRLAVPQDATYTADPEVERSPANTAGFEQLKASVGQRVPCLVAVPGPIAAGTPVPVVSPLLAVGYREAAAFDGPAVTRWVLARQQPGTAAGAANREVANRDFYLDWSCAGSLASVLAASDAVAEGEAAVGGTDTTTGATGRRAGLAGAPSAPSWVSASDGTIPYYIQITWAPSVGAISYALYRSTTSSPGKDPSARIYSGCTWQDYGPTFDVVYYYWIKAVGSSGTSGYSAVNTGYRLGSYVPAPTGVSASDGKYSDKVEVTWYTVSSPTSYQVFRGTSSSSNAATKLAEVSCSPYNDTTAVTGTTYYYWVKAKKWDGISGFSASNTGYRAVATPPAPTGVSASDGSYIDRVRITWTASSGATGYEVWRGTSSSSSQASSIGYPTTTTFDDMTMTPGTTYYYWVKAKSSGGTSGFSTSNTGYCARAIPQAPVGVAASDLTYGDKVRVTWTASTGATQYEIWRGTSPSSATASKAGTTTSTSFDDTGATPLIYYYYFVKAVGLSGTSGVSQPDMGVRLGIPSAPQKVSASGGTYTDKVLITWTGSSGTSTYEVYRSSSNSSANASRIGTATTTSYNDTTAVRTTTYYCWIKAVNAAGSSAFSNADSGRRG